jgi:hypothetical protein
MRCSWTSTLSKPHVNAFEQKQVCGGALKVSRFPVEHLVLILRDPSALISICRCQSQRCGRDRHRGVKKTAAPLAAS